MGDIEIKPSTLKMPLLQVKLEGAVRFLQQEIRLYELIEKFFSTIN